MAQPRQPQVASVFIYGEDGRDDGLEALHIEPLRERSMRHHWVIGAHRHPEHVQLMLFSEGGAVTRFEEVELHPARRCLAIHPAALVHSIQYEEGSEGLTITASLAYLKELSRALPEADALLAVPRVIDLAARYDEIARIYAQILQESTRKPLGWRAKIGALTLSLVVELVRLGAAPPAAQSHRRDREIAQAYRADIEVNFRTQRSMRHYASALALSPQRLNAACRSATGKGASELLYDRIVLEARRALAYSEMTIAEIGHDLGFADPAYFNRFFARHAGLPPGAWRAKFTATERASKQE